MHLGRKQFVDLVIEQVTALPSESYESPGGHTFLQPAIRFHRAIHSLIRCGKMPFLLRPRRRLEPTGGFWPAGIVIIGQFRVCHAEMGCYRMIRAGSQFVTQPDRANVRGILVPRPMRNECFVGNGKRIFQRLAWRFANGKSIFANQVFHMEADVLNDNRITHLAPASSYLVARQQAENHQEANRPAPTSRLRLLY